MAAITRLTLSASYLRPQSQNVWCSRNKRFSATRLQDPNGNLWEMKDVRGGRIHLVRVATLREHNAEIRATIEFEGLCIADGDRPLRMPA